MLQASQQLEHEPLFVRLGDLIVDADDVVQVRLQVVTHHIEFVEGSLVRREHNLVQIEDLPRVKVSILHCHGLREAAESSALAWLGERRLCGRRLC